MSTIRRIALAVASAASVAVSIAALGATDAGAQGRAPAESPGAYATVNGLRIYYEVHGRPRADAPPLVLLHGAFMNIDALGPLLPALADTRQVIAVELEGHGRTADLDRPLRYSQMAEDVAGLMRALSIPRADVFGFSLGGTVALAVAARHPSLVRKLVVVSAGYDQAGYYPSVIASFPGMSATAMAGTPMERAYRARAPHPDHWPAFVEKMKQLQTEFRGLTADEVRGIEAPALVVAADADLVRAEYMVEMYRLLGGARADGGPGPAPAARLAVIPGSAHFTVLYRTDVLVPFVTSFLDASAAGAPER
jgi:pimeloyl-ACP methyl ester carboxylesterase